MFLEPIKAEVRGMLLYADEHVRKAEQKLAGDDGRARVRAAGELVFLRARKLDLEARMHELENARGGTGGALVEWIREDWMILMQRLQSLIESH